MTRKRLEELLARQSPRIRRRYLAAMKRTRDRYTLAKLEDALESGAVSSVLDEVERAAALFAAQTEAVTALVANEVAEQLSKKLDVVVTYDGTNERAVAQLRANRARMVQGLREEARDAITQVLAERTAEGVNPRQQAQGIRDSIGLTPKQAEWVRSYRRRLETLDRGALGMELRDARYDGTVRRAIDDAKPLTAKQVDKMVERYYQRAIKYRAEVISRTETLRAVHEGAEQMYAQAVDDGTLDRDLIVQTWHATRDGRTRSSHIAMNGQRRRMGETFRSGNGYDLKYPCDPDAPASESAQCRCSKSSKVFASKEAAQAYLDGTTTPESLPTTDAPAGFRVPEDAKVLDGMPRRADIDEDEAVYRVPVDSLRGKVYALKAGVQEARLERIREAWAEGKDLPPVKLDMTPAGELLVGDGRHRLIVAAEQGRDVLLRLSRAVAGATEGAALVELPYGFVRAAA